MRTAAAIAAVTITAMITMDAPARRTHGLKGNLRVCIAFAVADRSVSLRVLQPWRSSLKIDGRGRKILVIDDDLAIRVLLQAVLRRMDFVVDLAEDGEQGLKSLDSGDYNLVLLDLMMPKVNGYEFLKAVNSRGVPRPHIIVFTAAGQRGVDRIPHNTVCNSILKPFDLEGFVELISDCVDARHMTGSGETQTAS